MKKYILAAFLAGVLSVSGVVFATDNPLYGKIIALDAGHGNGETGAVNQKYGVIEADVNLDVVQALETKLKNTYGAYVVVAERFSTRRDRVSDAVARCAALDVTGDGIADNKKCDVLVSVHHNGSTDPTHDGTLVIYNEKQDIPLAQKLHDALLPLTGIDEGYLHGGYGMTVYKNLVSVITEAYYITNDDEVSAWLSGTRTPQEVDAQILGLTNYFASQTGGKGGKPR